MGGTMRKYPGAILESFQRRLTHRSKGHMSLKKVHAETLVRLSRGSKFIDIIGQLRKVRFPERPLSGRS
jgi:hypothetical protein